MSEDTQTWGSIASEKTHSLKSRLLNAWYDINMTLGQVLHSARPELSLSAPNSFPYRYTLATPCLHIPQTLQPGGWEALTQTCARRWAEIFSWNTEKERSQENPVYFTRSWWRFWICSMLSSPKGAKQTWLQRNYGFHYPATPNTAVCLLPPHFPSNPGWVILTTKPVSTLPFLPYTYLRISFSDQLFTLHCDKNLGTCNAPIGSRSDGQLGITCSLHHILLASGLRLQNEHRVATHMGSYHRVTTYMGNSWL